MWYYKGQQFTEPDESYQGFVYLITNLSNQKMYVGKKNFWSIRKLPPLKGQKRRRTVKKESDWKEYYGSNEEVKLLLEDGVQFHREILRLCKTKTEMTYYEMKEQIDREVLFKDEYYNEFIGGKVNARGLQTK
jgi:hypothetical protein